MYGQQVIRLLSKILVSHWHSCSQMISFHPVKRNFIFLLSRDLSPCDSTVDIQNRQKSVKSHLDYTKVPTLDENDLEEQFVRGSGPGGQATAKTNNAVVLKHKPTGIIVKCHATRSLWDNKKRAREILITKLDNMINGEKSIENQKRALLARKSLKMIKKKEKMQVLKAAFKEREGLD